MKKRSRYILHIALSALAICSPTPDVATSDSVLRIIGDKTIKGAKDSRDTQASEGLTPAISSNTTIRIIGDKPILPQTPLREPATQAEPNLPPSHAIEIRIIGDKNEPARKITPAQPPIIKVIEQELATKTKAAAERRAKEEAEQQLAQKLARQKAEEERLATEKSAHEQLAKAKVELEKATAEAARQAAIQLEQLATIKAEQEKVATEAARQAAIQREQLKARKEEETRQAAQKEEQERIANEERLAAARKVLEETLRQGNQTAAKGSSPETPSRTSDSKAELPPATIWDLYLAAKDNDPALGRMEARVEGSKADSDVLRAALLPHVDSSAGIKQVSQNLSNYSAEDTTNNYTAFNYNVTARLTLLNIPTLYSLSAAAASLKVDQAGVAAARQNLIVKLTDSYFALLKAQTDKQIALGEINRLKQVFDQTQAFLKAGTGDIIAVYEAQSRLDGAKADLNKSESTLKLAEQKLASLVGKPITTIVNYLPQQPAGPDPDDVNWWVATMESEQPLVRQAREGLVQIAEQRKAARAEYLPTLQASGGYDVNRGTAALPTAEVKQWFVGASLSLPLYSGGETSARIRRAVASEEERRRLFDETMDQQRENVKQAFFNLRYNISFIRALEQRAASAEIQLAAISKGRKIGTRNAIDQLNAEQAYSVALRDYKYALYDNVIRVIQLKSAAGILAETDLSELPTAAPTLSSGLRMFPAPVSR